MHETLFLGLITLHILAATTWVGGLIFFMLAVVPAARMAPQAAIPFLLGRAFRPVAWVALGTLLATGPLLLWVQGMGPSVLARKTFWESAFGLTLIVKLSLIALVLALTAWHDTVLGPRAEVTHDMRPTRYVGRAIGSLSVAVLLAAILLAQGL
ncbi:MAG: CopD family protein [Acidiferrobacter sp.]